MPRHLIHSSEIKVGEPLPCDARDAKGTLLLRKGHVITSASQVEKLVKHAAWAESAEFLASAEAGHARIAPDASPLALVISARQHLNMLLSSESHVDFSDGLLRVAGMVRKACRANADVALASILMCCEEPYAVRHAVDVAIASHITGTAMKLDAATLTSTVAAALSMNIGMFELQQQLHTLEGPLSEAQRVEVSGHCERGVAKLRAFGVTDPLWLSIVNDHHECPDGSGYPDGKRAEDIDVTAQLVALADIYCARVSSRVHRSAMPPNMALRWLFLNEGSVVDEHYAALFIKTLGIYPPGTGVRLHNGSIGVVTHRGPTGQRPKVSSITTQDGLRVGVPIRRRGDSQEHKVIEVVDLDALELAVSMEALWGSDAVL